MKNIRMSVVALLILSLIGCNLMPFRKKAKTSYKNEVCLLVETKEILMDPNIDRTYKTDLLEGVVKRTERYMNEKLTARHIKMYSKPNCLPNNYTLLINYITFETESEAVGKGNVLNWKRTEHSKFKLKAEISIMNEKSDLVRREVETEDDQSMDHIIEEISYSAAKQTAESID